tara:strand:- start:183 stop:452 length:270 start_codon:yes stop_codon:yes gene_type:complete
VDYAPGKEKPSWDSAPTETLNGKQPLSLVEKIMTRNEAKKIIGRGPKWRTHNMRRALEIHPWNNTREDWKRLQACYVVMSIPHKKRISP